MYVVPRELSSPLKSSKIRAIFFFPKNTPSPFPYPLSPSSLLPPSPPATPHRPPCLADPTPHHRLAPSSLLATPLSFLSAAGHASPSPCLAGALASRHCPLRLTPSSLPIGRAAPLRAALSLSPETLPNPAPLAEALGFHGVSDICAGFGEVSGGGGVSRFLTRFRHDEVSDVSSFPASH